MAFGFDVPLGADKTEVTKLPSVTAPGGGIGVRIVIDEGLVLSKGDAVRLIEMIDMALIESLWPSEAGVSLNLADYQITDWTPLIGVRRHAWGVYSPTLEAADLLADLVNTTTVQVYYSDPARPDNSGDGLTPATAKRDASAAWAMAPGGAQTNRVKAILPASRILWGPRGTTSAISVTKNIIFEANDGGEIIIAGGALTAPPSWTSNGDGTYTCSSGVTSGSAPSAPVDWSPQARSRHPYNAGMAFTQATGNTAATDPAIRASLLPGQAYKQLSVGVNDLTIRPWGDAPPAVWQDYVTPGCINGNTLLMKAEDTTDANIRFHISRVFVNGGSPIIFQNRRTTAGGQPVVVADRCAAIAGTPSISNGISAQAACQFITYDCIFDAIPEDGLNPHSVVAGQPTWISGQCKTVDVRPRAGTVGRSGSGSSNLYTGHEDSRGIVIMPRGGVDAGGRPAAYIDTAKVTFFGGDIGASTRSGSLNNETVQAGLGASTGAQIALAEVVVGTSPGTLDIVAEAGGSTAVRCYGMTQGALRTSGNVTFTPLP